MYSWSPNLSQISLKKSFKKVVFQIVAKIKMTRNENRLFSRHFETVQIFIFFSWNVVVTEVRGTLRGQVLTSFQSWCEILHSRIKSNSFVVLVSSVG